MNLRERAVAWGWALLLAAPIFGLMLLARSSRGWISTLAWAGVFVACAAIFAVGMFYEVRAWAEIDDEFDPPDHRAGDGEHR